MSTTYSSNLISGLAGKDQVGSISPSTLGTVLRAILEDSVQSGKLTGFSVSSTDTSATIALTVGDISREVTIPFPLTADQLQNIKAIPTIQSTANNAKTDIERIDEYIEGLKDEIEELSGLLSSSQNYRNISKQTETSASSPEYEKFFRGGIKVVCNEEFPISYETNGAVVFADDSTYTVKAPKGWAFADVDVIYSHCSEWEEGRGEYFVDISLESETVPINFHLYDDHTLWEQGMGAAAFKRPVSEFRISCAETFCMSMTLTLVNLADRMEATEKKVSTLEPAKREVFVDLWEEACGSAGCFNAETGMFELNGITDISYQEAVEIYSCKDKDLILPPYSLVGWEMNGVNIRTNIPNFGRIVNNSLSGYGCRIDVLRLAGVDVDMNDPAQLKGCKADVRDGYLPNCRKVIGYVEINKIDDFFTFAPFLEEIRLIAVADINMGRCPLLSVESLRFLVENAANTEGITVTLHPEAFARLTPELVSAAGAKRITFAEAG